MKRFVKYIIAVLIIMGGLSGCEDFLETTSQDLIVPKTVEHYKELLQGEGYFKTLLSKSEFVLYMTDDVEYFGKIGMELIPNTQFTQYQDAYLWQEEIENEYFTDGCYQYLYKQILTANTCLNALDEMVGTIEEKEILEGQACFTRAFGYFLLANFYAQAYNEAAESDLCVPLILEPTPTTEKFARNTIKEVWGQMVSDCKRAIACLEGKDISGVYEINSGAALVLGMRIALFMEDFELVITYGKKVLEMNNQLYDITSKTQITGTSAPTSSPFVDKFIYPVNNAEIIWLYDNGETTSFYDLFNVNLMLSVNTFSISSTASNAVISVFQNQFSNKTEEEDKRLAYWFVAGMSSYEPAYIPLKYDRYNIAGDCFQSAFRTGEVYVSLAEAYARKEQADKKEALFYLNQLRANRILFYNDLKVSDFTTDEALVQFIWEERRRELCFEEHHRWWDLRRTGQPELTHDWQGGKTYKLPQKDLAYVINFPKAEREFNPNLNNPRSQRNIAY